MSSWSYRQCCFRGAEAIELVSDSIRLIILPGWGGRIVSITPRDKPENEILLQPLVDRVPSKAQEGPYIADQSWGWDDLFPSVAPCTIHVPELGNIQIPDHGELWSSKMQISHTKQECTLTTAGRILPYSFEKKLLPLLDGFRIEWRLKNLSLHPFPFLWSAHPLFILTHDIIVRLPHGVRTLSFEVPKGISTTFPISRRTLDFIDRGSKFALKYFHLSQIRSGDLPISIEYVSTGVCILMAFDIKFLPYLGIWINTGGWENQHTFALEPTTSYPDALVEAQRNTSARILAPRKVESWWFDVYLLKSRE